MFGSIFKIIVQRISHDKGMDNQKNHCDRQQPTDGYGKLYHILVNIYGGLDGNHQK